MREIRRHPGSPGALGLSEDSRAALDTCRRFEGRVPETDPSPIGSPTTMTAPTPFPETLEPTTPSELAQLLRAVRTVAVLGASSWPDKAGYYVPEYLQEHGYRILPVNPSYAGKELLGEPVVANLAELSEPIDMIDVFRRAELLPDHLDEVLAMDPRPRAVWLQLGIRHDDFARSLRDAGIIVVQDRCTLADHQRLGL